MALMDEFDELGRELWEQSKPPLEKMYDQWVGRRNWESKPPRTQFVIFSRADVSWRGIFVGTGEPFPCHLCGEIDRWVVEGDEVRRLARVFICEHEPLQIVRGGVRRISSVPVKLVARAEVTHQFLG